MTVGAGKGSWCPGPASMEGDAVCRSAPALGSVGDQYFEVSVLCSEDGTQEQHTVQLGLCLGHAAVYKDSESLFAMQKAGSAVLLLELACTVPCSTLAVLLSGDSASIWAVDSTEEQQRTVVHLKEAAPEMHKRIALGEAVFGAASTSSAAVSVQFNLGHEEFKGAHELLEDMRSAPRNMWHALYGTSRADASDFESYAMAVFACVNRIAASASSLRSVTEQPIETRECSHPYSPNMDTRETISFEGASSLVVEFDPQCRTESSCDWLKLFAGPQPEESRLLCSFTGENWQAGPAGSVPELVDGVKQIVVQGNQLSYHFHSDGSNEMWGYKFTVKPVSNKPKKMACVPMCVEIKPHTVLLLAQLLGDAIAQYLDGGQGGTRVAGLLELLGRQAHWGEPVSYTHLRAHETVLDLVCRLLLEKKNKQHTHC
eukprot:TRINITY_DN34905_c0_g1_i1.p1 TRINITY_DN34905_c0_g1~~TRINITY_DN34905_c0_g1_i1.p1  ORF type:complete len:429 (+),score=120.48 TRINITY_DN34905_c0_g1_i1:117-1403(+)